MIDDDAAAAAPGCSLVRGAPYLMAGKTGTAQKISRRGGASVDPHQLPFHLRHQALFVGYAPADNPTIAVAVAVEHGGFGASTAGADRAQDLRRLAARQACLKSRRRRRCRVAAACATARRPPRRRAR